MTGRKPSSDKLIPRTVRNRPDVDAVLVQIAQRDTGTIADVLRDACERLAKSEEVRA